MVRTFRDFLAKVEAGGPDTLAFVYFSGHALSFEGENYLLGVDARLARDSDIPIEGVRLSDLHAAARRLAGARQGDDDRRHAAAAVPAPGQGVGARPRSDRSAAGHADRLRIGTRHGRARPARQLRPLCHRDRRDAARARHRPRNRVHAHPQPHPSDHRGPADAVARFRAGEQIELRAAGGARPRACRRRRRSARRGRCATSVPTRLMRWPSRWTRSKATPASSRPIPAIPTRKRVWAMIRARREALAWMRARESNTPQSYWTYLRRYPNGMYAFDAERRLRRLGAAGRAAAGLRHDGVRRRADGAVRRAGGIRGGLSRRPAAAARSLRRAASGLSRQPAAAAAARRCGGAGARASCRRSRLRSRWWRRLAPAPRRALDARAPEPAVAAIVRAAPERAAATAIRPAAAPVSVTPNQAVAPATAPVTPNAAIAPSTVTPNTAAPTTPGGTRPPGWGPGGHAASGRRRPPAGQRAPALPRRQRARRAPRSLRTRALAPNTAASEHCGARRRAPPAARFPPSTGWRTASGHCEPDAAGSAAGHTACRCADSAAPNPALRRPRRRLLPPVVRRAVLPDRRPASPTARRRPRRHRSPARRRRGRRDRRRR